MTNKNQNVGVIPINSGNVSTKSARYAGPEQTAAVRSEIIRDVVKAQAGLLFARPTNKVHLNDIEEVINATREYVELCIEKGVIPGFQGLAVLFGVSRNALYDFLRKKPDSPSGIFLEKARCAFTAARQNAVDRGGASEAMSIFLMKNSYQSYTDKVEITPVDNRSPLDEMDADAARQRLIDSIPAEDDDDAEV